MANKNNRRTFLQTAGALTIGATIAPLWACKNIGASGDGASLDDQLLEAVNRGSLDKFGIQLYTLRDVIPNDPKGTLKTLSEYGYQQIEGYETDKVTIFQNMPHLEFKKYISDLGINMVSSHCNINEDFEKKAAQAAEIGMKYLVCPWIGPKKNAAEWKEVTETFNKCGEICKKNGIGFAYHNHAYTYKAFSGMIPQDFMMENTDPALVDFEMDIYWVVTGGADPIEYLKKYPNRFRLCHVKDRMKNAGDERSASCNLGSGIIDFPTILKEAKDHGMQYFIMEQERYDGTTPMEAARVGANYLSDLKFA